MEEPVLSIGADASDPVPMECQLPPPSLLPQRPWRAIDAMSMSSSGLADKNAMLPQSEGMLARFAVMFTQVPCTGGSSGAEGPSLVTEASPPGPLAPPGPPSDEMGVTSMTHPTPRTEKRHAKARTRGLVLQRITSPGYHGV